MALQTKVNLENFTGLSSEDLVKLNNTVQAERCRRSFFYFVQTMWSSSIPEKPVWNWHIKYICHELQAVAERVFAREPKKYDLIINVPPGSTKSTICSVMFPIWVWIRDPVIRSLCSSYSGDLSLDLSVKSRDLMKTKRFTELFPNVKVRQDLDSKGYFGNTEGGRRYSTSTSGTATGMHGHFLIIDDPINPRGAISEAALKECKEWYDQTFSTRKIDKKVSVTLLIMQRLGLEDLTQHLLEKKNVKLKHICLPAEDEYEIKPAKLKKYYKNGLLDPVRLDRDVLDEQMANLGGLSYAGQFGQSPRRSEGNLFLENRGKIVDELPSPVEKAVRYWDKAGTEGGTGAQTAGTLLARLQNGQFAVLDCITGRWSSERREQTILDTAALDGLPVRIVVEQEPGSGGKESAEGTVKRLQGYIASADRVTGDKILRAHPWSIVWNQGNVVILNRPWTQDYINEHLFFPRGKTKDRVDSSSGAFASLTRNIKRGGLW